jgi:UPF0271 protein
MIHETRPTIDLNCDLGEIPALVDDGTQEALMGRITSANIACGGHAGDEAIMEATLRSAARHGVAAGAHPGFPDREGFGRRLLPMSPKQVAESVAVQIERLAAIAARCGVRIVHVKPHGALYKAAARDRSLAEAIAAGTARVSRDVLLVGLAGSPCLAVYAEAGFGVAPEAFADRRYEPDGALRSRNLPGALLEDPAAAAAQAVSLARDGYALATGGARLRLRATTLCLHSDTPGAVAIAEAVAAALRDAGVRLAPPAS